MSDAASEVCPPSGVELPELPATWRWGYLANVLQRIEAGKSFKCDERPPSAAEFGIVKVSAVTWGFYDEAESKTITDASRIDERYLIRTGDFLFSRANTIGLVGASVLVHATEKKLLLSDKILRFVMQDDLKEWLNWMLKSGIGRKQIEALSTGNQESMRNIGQERIGRICVPIPPEAERRRIESKIALLFSEIDEGERALKRVQQLLERYRQSVLKAAVTGELTREWREKHQGPLESGEALLQRILQARREAWERAELEKMTVKGGTPTNDKWRLKYQEPVGPNTLELAKLPNGWTWATVEQIGFVSGGLTKNQRRSGYTDRRPYLRVANVYSNLLDLADVHEIGVLSEELDRVTLASGDLLVVEGNGSIDQIGRVAVWDGSISNCVHQNHLIKVRCTELLRSWYLLIWCTSPVGREIIRRAASSTAGLHTLSISKIQSLPIPIPNEGELLRIRDAFDRMESLISQHKLTLQSQLERINAARSVVLREAFGGRLISNEGPLD